MDLVKMNESKIGSDLYTVGINSCSVTIIKLEDNKYLMSHFSPFNVESNSNSIKNAIKKSYDVHCLIIRSPYFCPSLFFYKNNIKDVFNSVNFRVLDYRVPSINELFSEKMKKNNNSFVSIKDNKISTKLWELEIKNKNFDYFFK